MMNEKRKRELEEKYNPTIPKKDDGLCVRCKKNKATITYANSILDWTHGGGERICQECYTKQKMGSAWYVDGKKDMVEDEIKFLKSLLQDKHQKKLSRARTQDTKRKTIPDMYDTKIKERIKQLKEVMKDDKEKS